MSKFFDDTMQGLLEAIEIEKGSKECDVEFQAGRVTDHSNEERESFRVK